MQPSGTDRPVSQDVEMPMAENAAAIDQLIRPDFEKAFKSDLEVSYMFMSLPGFVPRAVALGRATAERAECRLREEFAAFMTHYFIPYHRSISSSVREEHVACAAVVPGRAELCHSESSKALCLHRFPVITTSGVLDDEGAFATLVDDVAKFWEYVSSTQCCCDVQAKMDSFYIAQFCEPSNGYQEPDQHDSRDRWTLRTEALGDFVQKTFRGAFPGPGEVPRGARTGYPWEGWDSPSFKYGDASATAKRMFLKHVAQLVGRVFTAFLMTPGCPLDSERRRVNELAYMEEAVRQLVPLPRPVAVCPHPSSRIQVGLGAPEADHQPTQGEPQTDSHALAALHSHPDTVLNPTSTPSSSTLSSSTTSSHSPRSSYPLTQDRTPSPASSVGCGEEGCPSVFDDDKEETCDGGSSNLYGLILRRHEPRIASVFYGAEAWKCNASI
ncbi:hypothetical protein EG328_008072 [Venturia inaequalis]|uniref:Uncharacterized protein n=1 Tax=Venturia inaequalis TaxID=5025 RepID=A0A8H3UDT6_VENIN|nr:hypothetical protein EG328_008072 [Venturia inaequalis]